MLKIINNRLDFIRFEGEGDSGDGDGGGGEVYVCVGCSRSSCESEAQGRIDEADAEIIAADNMIKEFDLALETLQKNKENLKEIGEGYAGFLGNLNDSWRGKADLNGYQDIVADRECLRNYTAAIGNAIVDLETEKSKWSDYKRNWESAKREAENDKAACAGCPCA